MRKRPCSRVSRPLPACPGVRWGALLTQTGKKPKRKMEDLPKATKKLEARTEDLGIEKNLNKTVLVQTTTTGKGPRGAGFYVSLRSAPRTSPLHPTLSSLLHSLWQ